MHFLSMLKTNWLSGLSGYGRFTMQFIQKGEFVAEYTGTLVDLTEAENREDQTYIYYFGLHGREHWYVFHLCEK
jgi:SET domain-containing protein